MPSARFIPGLAVGVGLDHVRAPGQARGRNGCASFHPGVGRPCGRNASREKTNHLAADLNASALQGGADAPATVDAMGIMERPPTQ